MAADITFAEGANEKTRTLLRLINCRSKQRAELKSG